MPELSERSPRGTFSLLEAQAVREQLNRLLAHPLFTHSRRYPVLLTYVVEQALLGNPEELRERAIGVEAFAREPDYDVAIDPVVRVAAAEVRKRLVQYYYNPEHAGELVIELPLGSYTPGFRDPGPRAGERNRERNSGPDAGEPAANPSPISTSRARLLLCLLAVLIPLAAAGGFWAGRLKAPARPSSLERFWQAIRPNSGRVTYCLGVPTAAYDYHRLMPPGTTVWGGLDASDVTTLARSMTPLVHRGDSFRVVSAAEIGFDQLRGGPVVLIGAFDNSWTMRLTQDLPVGYEYRGQERVVVDRRGPSRQAWAMQYRQAGNLSRDYAIVGRFRDRLTGQPVILLGGILGPGTEAASEIASDPALLDAMLARAPANWDDLNLEAVVETQVIEGHAGPPTVLEVVTWPDSPIPGR